MIVMWEFKSCYRNLCDLILMFSDVNESINRHNPVISINPWNEKSWTEDSHLFDCIHYWNQLVSDVYEECLLVHCICTTTILQMVIEWRERNIFIEMIKVIWLVMIDSSFLSRNEWTEIGIRWKVLDQFPSWN